MPMTVDDILRLYEDAKTKRSVHEEDWRKAAAYCMPMHYGLWTTSGPVQDFTRGREARRVAYDTTGLRSLPKYVAILERLATPSGQRWHTLTASDATLRKQKRVRAYFDELTQRLFRMRSNPKARFRVASNELYRQLGVYGNGPMYVGRRDPKTPREAPGVKYVSCSLHNVFVLVDDEGNLHGIFRRFYLNARQFSRKFPDTPMPPSVGRANEQSQTRETTQFEFVHYVSLRDQDEYDPFALDHRRHPFGGMYICVQDKCPVGEPSGYQSNPYIFARTSTVAEDPYGYSPAMIALSSMGGASQIKKTSLKAGNKAVDPALMAASDNAMNGAVDQRPGHVNYGGVTRDGKRLIYEMPTGDFRVAETLLQDERSDVEDCFFVTLFQILTETPEMTATEVMERVAEKAALLSPTMGYLQSEFLGPDIEREIDVLSEIGGLPEMPPELVEAQGEYEVVYTSPLAKSMYAEDVSGFMRSVETALGIVSATQDPSALDHFNFDTAIPEMANYMSVPERWINSQDNVEQQRQARAKQMEQAQMMDNAPALASAAKTVTEMGGRRK